MIDKPIKVLLIEDSPVEARLIQIMLTETLNKKVDLIWANRLSTGLEHLNTNEFDVLLLDLGLPDSWGIETISRVHTQAPHLPILVLTGCKDEALAIQAVKS